nr:hypothetical protein [Tanacetum cinerariifolium]
GAMHLAKHSPADGGDSKVSGDGGGVGMARSLSTFASGGRDMEVCGRIVILVSMVVVSVKGGGIVGYVPSGGGSGGDGNAAGAVHLARCYPTEGGDSEASGDGDGVGMARSLSTSAFGGKDMAA